MAAELEKQSKPKAKHTNNYSKEVGLILAALREFSQKFLWQSLVPHTHTHTFANTGTTTGKAKHNRFQPKLGNIPKESVSG